MSKVKVVADAEVFPEGYLDKLSRVEVAEQKNGNVVYGIIEFGTGEDTVERKVPLDLNRAWGYDPKERERYLEDPVTWTVGQLSRQVAELTKQKATLENRVAELEAKLGASTGQPDVELQTVQQVPAESIQKPPVTEDPTIETSASPSTEAQAPPPQASSLAPETTPKQAEIKFDDKVRIKKPDGTFEDGWTVKSGVWKDEDGDDRITLAKNGGELVFPKESDLKEWQEDEAKENTGEQIDNSSSSPDAKDVQKQETTGFRNHWNRMTGRIGRFIMGSNAAITTGLYNLADKQGRRVVTLEEVRNTETVDGYTESERRNGVVALVGGAALAGAGLLAGYLLWHKGGHDVINSYGNSNSPGGTEAGNHHHGLFGHDWLDGPEKALGIDLDGDGDIAGVDIGSIPNSGLGADEGRGFSSLSEALSQSGAHLGTYNLEHGRDIVEVVLPKNLDITTTNGVASLFDVDTGKTVLRGSDLPRGMFQTDGQLSRAAIEHLNDLDYDIDSVPKKIRIASGIIADHRVSVVS